MPDLRDEIFRAVMDRTVTAVIRADDAGVVAGTREAAERAESLGLRDLRVLREGQAVRAGDEVARLTGNPKQIALAEDLLLGLIAKPSGIATATRRCVDRAGEAVQIVCGAWKKMPAVLKEAVRNAVAVGGGHFRITPDPFVYLDKNYVRMLGGIRETLLAVAHLTELKKVVQLRGNGAGIGDEAREAVAHGADILFIDTGRPEDIRSVAEALDEVAAPGGRPAVAFGGGVRPEDIDALKAMPVDILEIGRPIVDAPLLDLRLEVVAMGSPGEPPT